MPSVYIDKRGVPHIYRQLKRSNCRSCGGTVHHNAQCRACEMRASGDGYTVADLCRVFGVRPHKVRSWMARGLLGAIFGGQVASSQNVALFLRRHYAEYDLHQVDQVWFKSMVFAELAEVIGGS